MSNSEAKRPCDTCAEKEDCWLSRGYVTCKKLNEWNKKVTEGIDF